MERDLRRRVTARECETHHKVSQSNTFFFRLMSPGGGDGGTPLDAYSDQVPGEYL